MASLIEALYALPTERLRGLVQRRKMDLKKLALIPAKRQLVQFLAQEFSKPASITQAILECDARQLRLLQLLLVGEEDRGIAWPDLLAVAGGERLSEALHTVAYQLEDLGLAFDLGARVYIPPVVAQQIPASLPDRYTLARCLNSNDAVALKRICSNLGLPQDTKNDNIEAIRSHLIAGEGRMLQLKNPLTADEVEVLEYLIQVGGAAMPTEVASAVLAGQTEDFFRYDWQNRWKQGRERNAIDTLLGRGLVHVVAYNYGYNLILILPGDLLRSLTGNSENAFWTRPIDGPKPLLVASSHVTRHTTLIRDVVALLGYCAAQDAARTNTGYIHKTHLKNIARQLSLPEERYASFLYAVCRAADLIAAQGEKQIYAITPRGNSWLHWEGESQTRTLFEAWRKGEIWAEMCTEPLQKAGEYRPKEMVVDMREAAIRVLTEVTPEPFYTLDSVTERLAFRHPLMLARGPSLSGDLVNSPALFVRLLIGECLTWLGLVELGWETVPPAPPAALAARGEAVPKTIAPDPTAYRLTPMGAYLLGLSSTPPQSEPREEQFIVQANAEIFQPPYLDPATLYHLLSLTEAPAKGGSGNTVSLTRQSIRRCLDRGDTTRDILAFLQAHARTGIPQNVEYLINEVGSKHGHIHIGRAQMYLQTDSPLLLQELQARKEIKPYFVRALGDTVAILKAEDEEKLLRELRKAGYLPISDDAPRTRTLGVKTRPAPVPAEPPATSTEKLIRKAVKADATVDWNRIAQEDGMAWNDKKMPASAIDTTRNPALIKFLLQQTVRQKKLVEVEITGLHGEVETHLLRPNRMTDHSITAFYEASNEYISVPLSSIKSARVVPE